MKTREYDCMQCEETYTSEKTDGVDTELCPKCQDLKKAYKGFARSHFIVATVKK